jgi:hypothetical protein
MVLRSTTMQETNYDTSAKKAMETKSEAEPKVSYRVSSQGDHPNGS